MILFIPLMLTFQNCAGGFNTNSLNSLSSEVDKSGDPSIPNEPAPDRPFFYSLTGVGQVNLSTGTSSPYVYNYAPVVIKDNGQTHMWTCSNLSTPGTIRDVIGHFKNNQYMGAAVSNSDNRTSFDGEHACDPSIIKGNFKYNGTSYQYLMSYLGEDWNDANGDGVFDCKTPETCEYSMHNQIGVAFANSLDGPWIKHPYPIITFADRTHWGVGQPSLIKKSNGNILLFYTQGDKDRTTVYFREFNFSNMFTVQGPQVIAGAIEIPSSGLVPFPGVMTVMNRNADMVMDAKGENLWMIRASESGREKGQPEYYQLASIKFADLVQGKGSWTVIRNIDRSITGYPNNHNAGFARSPDGILANPDELEIYVTADTGVPTQADGNVLWDFKIVKVTFSIH